MVQGPAGANCATPIVPCEIYLFVTGDQLMHVSGQVRKVMTRSKAELTLLVPGLVLGASGSRHVMR